MKVPLKYFLVVSLILGAFVGPLGYHKYQEWKKQQETKSSAIVIQFMQASEVAAVVREVYREQLKASATSKPALSILVDERANLLMVSAPDEMLSEIKQLIKAIDQAGGPVRPVAPIRTSSPQEVQKALED